jgi:hypothetical protein
MDSLIKHCVKYVGENTKALFQHPHVPCAHCHQRKLLFFDPLTARVARYKVALVLGVLPAYKYTWVDKIPSVHCSVNPVQLVNPL